MGIPGEPCGTCGHVLVRHRVFEGCQVDGCVCADFLFGPGPGKPVRAERPEETLVECFRRWLRGHGRG